MEESQKRNREWIRAKKAVFYSCHGLDRLIRRPYGLFACHPKLGHMTRD